MRCALLCAAALAAACSNPSRLDAVVGGDPGATLGTAAASDPWAALASSGTSLKGDDDAPGGLGGLDLQGILKKVFETLKKPGPYEAPAKAKGYEEGKPYTAVLALGGGVVEREAYGFSLFGGSGRGTELRALIDRLRQLAKDPNLTALVLRVDALSISLPDVTELRVALHELRAAGKVLACHTEGATNATYLVLTACERLGIAPLGQVAITGPAAMPIHVKGLLDKLGVQADFLHVGAYKGAAEPLTREAPSEEMKETITAILDRHYQTMVDVIARDRKLAPAAVQGLIDNALFSSEQAKTAKLVDEVGSFEAFRDGVAKAPWTKIELEDSAGKDLKTMVKLAQFVGMAGPDRPFGPHVAVVYALGNIVDGDGKGVLGAREEIAAQTLVAALRAIAADDDVKAVVLRIDSGGGSAQASELIWRAVAQVKERKPVIVSMSDVAASGGYYIAAGATKIFAHEDTLTGSIGVVGGKVAPAPALAKVGVTTYPMGRGKRATILASLSPWSEADKAVIRASMEEVYTVFVGRVAEGRKLARAQVEALAQGRVWTGAKAKTLGLVDEIGGLDAAIAEARKLGGVGEAAGLQVYPPSPSLRDFFRGFGEVSAPLGAALGLDRAVLAAIDPEVAAAAERLVRLVLSFQATRIQAIAVLPAIR